jgi:polar amino acid transport system substrate-binding protein
MLQHFKALIPFCVFTWTLIGHAVQAAEWPEILRRGHLIVAVKENLRPLGFRDRQGQLQGFEIDLARQLAQDLLGDSTAVVLTPVLNQDRLKTVLEGDVDVAIANITTTDNRRRIISFSLPYYTSSTRLITQAPQIREPNDLQTIAVLQHSHNIAVLRSAFPTANLIGVGTYPEAMSYLAEGRADAFAGDQAVLTGWLQQNPAYRVLGPSLTRQSLAVALPKGLQYNSLLDKINQSLGQLSQSGWLEHRLQYWGLK